MRKLVLGARHVTSPLSYIRFTLLLVESSQRQQHLQVEEQVLSPRFPSISEGKSTTSPSSKHVLEEAKGDHVQCTAADIRRLSQDRSPIKQPKTTKVRVLRKPRATQDSLGASWSKQRSIHEDRPVHDGDVTRGRSPKDRHTTGFQFAGRLRPLNQKPELFNNHSRISLVNDSKSLTTSQKSIENDQEGRAGSPFREPHSMKGSQFSAGAKERSIPGTIANRTEQQDHRQCTRPFSSRQPLFSTGNKRESYQHLLASHQNKDDESRWSTKKRREPDFPDQREEEDDIIVSLKKLKIASKVYR